MTSARSPQPLDDVADMLSGGTPRKSNQSYWNGSIPWLTPKDMGKWSGVTGAKVSTEAIGNGTRLAPADAIFIVVRGMSLHNEIRVLRPAQAMTFNQDIKAIVARRDIDPRYLHYAILSKKPELLDAVEAAGHGTGRLPTDRLKDLPIPRFGSLTETAIADLLSALDRRIDLNRRMNGTLEAMARAVFKDWFVDFGPTRAKAEGREPYLAPELWDLFPDALDDEDKPEGWHHWTIADLAVHHRATVAPAENPDRVFEHFSIPAHDAGRYPALDDGASIKSRKTAIPANAVLLSKLNPNIPRVWIPNPPNGLPQVASTEFLAFTPKSPATRSLLYCLFRDIQFRREMEAMVTGTSKSHQRVPPKALVRRRVLAGASDAFEQFDRYASPLLSQVLRNRGESRTLAQTRDLLLPKLMSGEIRVSEADNALEAVA